MATAIERVDRNFSRLAASLPDVIGYELGWLLGSVVVRVYISRRAKDFDVAICGEVFAFVERANERAGVPVLAVIYPRDVGGGDVLHHSRRLQARYPFD